jgi:hypothetical protein
VSIGDLQHIVDRIGFLEKALTADPRVECRSLADILRFDKLAAMWSPISL